MILSDFSIAENIDSDLIGVEPEPREEQFQPASLDVRFGVELHRCSDGYAVNAPQHRLLPGERYLGHTKERIELPDHIAAQLTGRSSVGRRGVIVHKTAGWIDPGFEGQITLEMMNMGEEAQTFHEGERVAQLVFFKLDRPSDGYDGQYQNQTGVTKSR